MSSIKSLYKRDCVLSVYSVYRVYFVSDCVFYTSKVEKMVFYIVFNVWMETRCLGYERCLKHEKRAF